MNSMKQWMIAGATLLALAPPAGADPEVIRKSLEQKMPGMQLGAISLTPYAGLYEVVVNGKNIVYTDAKGQFAFVGSVVEIATKENLSDKRLAELRRVDFAKLPLDRAFVKVKGKGERKIAVFSDPDCPYCKKFEQELDKVDNVTIYTFLFPIAQLHPDAMRKATLVWCSGDRVKAWDDLMLRGVEPKGALDCATPMLQNIELARQLGIEGTPGIVLSTGRLYPGAVSAATIEQGLREGG